MLSVNDVAKWFLLQDDDGVSNLKLQKLLYYAQGAFLAVYDKPLFNEEIQAWMHGPVVPEVYQKYKTFGKNPIEDDDFSNSVERSLAKNEIDLLKEVHEVYGSLSAWKLRDMTHEDDCWKKHYSMDKGSDVIPLDDIKSTFMDKVN